MCCLSIWVEFLWQGSSSWEWGGTHDVTEYIHKEGKGMIFGMKIIALDVTFCHYWVTFSWFLEKDRSILWTEYCRSMRLLLFGLMLLGADVAPSAPG